MDLLKLHSYIISENISIHICGKRRKNISNVWYQTMMLLVTKWMILCGRVIFAEMQVEIFVEIEVNIFVEI